MCWPARIFAATAKSSVRPPVQEPHIEGEICRVDVIRIGLVDREILTAALLQELQGNCIRLDVARLGAHLRRHVAERHAFRDAQLLQGGASEFHGLVDRVVGLELPDDGQDVAPTPVPKAPKAPCVVVCESVMTMTSPGAEKPWSAMT